MFRGVVERLKTLMVYDTPVGKFRVLKTNLIGPPKDIELVLPEGSPCHKLYMSPGAGTYVEVPGRTACIIRERNEYVIILPKA